MYVDRVSIGGTYGTSAGMSTNDVVRIEAVLGIIMLIATRYLIAHRHFQR